MSEKIIIDGSLKTFEIEFKDRKESVLISFNPCDRDLPKRLFEAQKIIEEKTKSVGEYKIDENGIPDIDEYIEKSNKINQTIYDAIDYAFGNKVSMELFKFNSPMAIVGGKYFVQYFLIEIAPLIAKNIETEQRKANEYANKYLSKYVKKC